MIELPAPSPVATRPLGGSGGVTALSVAAAIVAAQPVLGLDALRGWLFRGGWLALLLPIATLPDPIGVATLIGPDLVQATGPSARVAGLLALAGGAGLLLVVVALLGAGVADLAAFERVAADPATDRIARPGVAGHVPGSLAGRARRRVVAELVLLQVVALVPFALAVGPALGQLAEVARRELIQPDRLDLPLAVRVAGGAWASLAALGAWLVFADLVHALAAGELLAVRHGLVERHGWRAGAGGALFAGLGRLIRRPLETLLTAAAGWLATCLGLGLGLGAIAVAWPWTRDAFLAQAGGASGPLLAVAAMVALALALVLVVAVALALLAFAAAIRSALWWTDALR